MSRRMQSAVNDAVATGAVQGAAPTLGVDTPESRGTAALADGVRQLLAGVDAAARGEHGLDRSAADSSSTGAVDEALRPSRCSRSTGLPGKFQ